MTEPTNRLQLTYKWQRAGISDFGLTMEPCIFGASCALVGSKVFVHGGTNTARGYIKEFRIFDLKALNWSEVKGVKPEDCTRRFHHMHLVGDRLYISSGYSQAGMLCYDLVLSKLSKVREKYDNGLTAEDLQSRSNILEYHERRHSFILVGGNHEEKAELFAFNLRSKCWSDFHASGKPPTSRTGHFSHLRKDNMYVCGGVNNAKGMLNDLFILTLGSNPSWTMLKKHDPSQAGRLAGSISILKGRLVIFGGIPNHLPNETVLVFDTHKKMIEKEVQLIGRFKTRRWHGTVETSEGILIVGGSGDVAGIMPPLYQVAWIL